MCVLTTRGGFHALRMGGDTKGNRVLTCVYFPQRDSDRPHSPNAKIAGTENPFLHTNVRTYVYHYNTNSPHALAPMHLPSAPCPHMHNIKIVTESCVSTLKPWTAPTMARSPPYILGEGLAGPKPPICGVKGDPTSTKTTHIVVN